MAGLLDWKEVESFDTPHLGAILAEEPEEISSYAAEDIVRVYIKLEEGVSAKEVIGRISEEVLGNEYSDIKSSTLEESLITVDIPYGQIAAVKELEGVAAVELTGKAETAQAKEVTEETEFSGEESAQEAEVYTDRQENTGMVQVPNANPKEETDISDAEPEEVEIYGDGQESAGMIQLETTVQDQAEMVQKGTQTVRMGSLPVAGAVLLLVIVTAGFLVAKRHRQMKS